MPPAAREELVECYHHDWADWPGTHADHVAEFIAWLDDVMPSGHVVYHVLQGSDGILSLARTHDNEHPGELLIEALQTTDGHLRQGHAKRLISHLQAVVDQPLVASVFERNTASQRTLVACGFTKAAPGRDERHDLWRFPSRG